MNWIQLTEENQIQDILKSKRTSIVFKHSTRCHISAFVLKMLEQTWNEDPNVDCYFLDLLRFRNLSNILADVCKVYHESPQVLLIMNGECVFDASHQDIQADEIAEQIQLQTIPK